MERNIRTCPCKTLPLSLSSFTAASFGDLHALARRGPSVIHRRDAGGYTPLHLASQHGHSTATALLLHMGADVEGGSGRGEGGIVTERCCTPLHRASFSGAVASMRILLDANANLLARDQSFGDEMTPLHKAVAGGRYLAVQLLLKELKQSGSLEEGLAAKDALGRSPLELAMDFQKRPVEEEHSSVKRWDAIAGGSPDWSKCFQLLRLHSFVAQKSPGEEAPVPFECLVLPRPPRFTSALSCLDCKVGSDGNCQTTSWERALQKALASSVATVGKLGDTQGLPNHEIRLSHGTNESSPLEGVGAINESRPLGKFCPSCGVRCFALYRKGRIFLCRDCLQNK